MTVIRQERYGLENSNKELYIPSLDKYYSIIDYSYFGLAILSEKPIETDLTINNVSLTHEKRQILSSHDVIVRRCDEKDDHYVVGMEVLSGHIPIFEIENTNYIKKLKTEIIEYSNKYNDIPHLYKLKIYEIKNKLSRVKDVISNIDLKERSSNYKELESLERLFVTEFATIIHNIISEGNIELHEHLKSINANEETAQQALNFFRDELGPYIFESPFTKRSYEKPLGYAGDYEMMNQIYRNDGFGYTLFGSCMERAIQLHAEPQAVRNRVEYFVNKILELIEDLSGKKDSINVLSVASGPAREIQSSINYIKEANPNLKKINFYLFDQDLSSLKNAQFNIYCELKKVGLNDKVEVYLVNKSIRSLIKEGLGDIRFDLIYSSGLFDYLDDKICTITTQRLFKYLNSPGKLIIGNFAKSSPNSFGMKSLFNWELILRSEEDLLNIFSAISKNIHVEKEQEGVNLFCVIQKNE